MDVETFKALLLINGGGAVVLLWVFSALVGKDGSEQLLSAVLWAVFGMMLGSAFRNLSQSLSAKVLVTLRTP